jgi:hypothetical protein
VLALDVVAHLEKGLPLEVDTSSESLTGFLIGFN